LNFGGIALKTYSIRVIGRVQGVGFRYFTLQKARSYNIYGWVKNLPDGSVEISACGENDNVEAFIETIRKGPSYAVVNDLIINEFDTVSHTISAEEFVIR